MIIKKITLFVLVLAFSVIFSACSPSSQNNSNENTPTLTADSEGKTVLYFFWGEGCSHCLDEKAFLEKMKAKYPDLEVKSFETWKNKENAALFQKMAAAYGTRAGSVPATFIGDGDPFVGFSQRMEADMENRIKTCLEQGCINPGDKLYK
jgi:thiol-disulfide isomerase/thioredoxin